MTPFTKIAGVELERDVNLAKYTAARMGGNAHYFYLAKPDSTTEQLAEVIQAAWQADIPVRVIGGGANILISDKGFRGLIIVNRLAKIEFGNWHDGRNVSATGGTGIPRFARACASQGLTGMEWAIGVPGTVGGAIINNAGAHGGDMADSVADVVVLEYENGVQLYTNADMQYDYRHSILKSRDDKRFIVLLATFTIPKGDEVQIQHKMYEYNTYRKRTQPPGASLGSIFKNPDGDYAGRLIEASGLKGYRIGGVNVSQKHANFFVNDDGATASEYYALIQHVQQTVLDEHGVKLELEIELIGDWS